MPKMSGTVQSIDVKKTQNGKTFYRVNVDGRWYSMWEKPAFEKGDTIEFNDIQKGDFHNLADVSKVEANAVPAASTTSFNTSRPNGSFDPDRESRIVRQNATSSAVALVAASKLAGKADVETVFATVKEVAKKLFSMNMFGYNFDDTAKPEAKAKEEGTEPGADALFKY